MFATNLVRRFAAALVLALASLSVDTTHAADTKPTNPLKRPLNYAGRIYEGNLETGGTIRLEVTQICGRLVVNGTMQKDAEEYCIVGRIIPATDKEWFKGSFVVLNSKNVVVGKGQLTFGCPPALGGRGHFLEGKKPIEFDLI